MSPEELYLRLRQVVQEMPPLKNGPVTAEMNQWLGRASALVQEAGDVVDAAGFQVAAQALGSESLRALNAQTIAFLIHKTLAAAEMRAPISMQGHFIGVGSALDAIGAFAKVFATATTEVLIIDAYADANALTEFGRVAPENIRLRLLTDSFSYKAGLRPAAEGWRTQFGSSRPLEVMLSAPRALHDRLVQIDGTTVWTFGQALRDFATRSPTYLSRLDPDTAAQKVTAYAAIWAAGSLI